MFELNVKNIYKKARTGFLITPHGKIETPNLAIVATHGKIKLLDDADTRRANPDFIIANTFHLFVNDKVKEIKKAGGLHKWSGFKKPIMTDSGGFQVFSLGWGKVYGIGKFEKQKEAANKKFLKSSQVKISEKGVVFKYNDKRYKLTPESSIKIQEDLGADIIFAFDEPTSPLHSHIYTKKSMELTHRWAARSLKSKKRKDQALFGIVQGGIYEDLRKKSARFIGDLDFQGFGIGGSYGEKQMKDVLRWTLPLLPSGKPRHLLGVGKIRDIFIAVKQGIDLFDCVVPTREARHGVLYAKAGKTAIEKSIFTKDKKVIERGCNCFVCKSGIRRNDLRQFFKTDRIRGQRLATIHNIYFFKNLFSEIREAVMSESLNKLEKEYSSYTSVK